MEPILIAGEWRQAEAPLGAFSAVDPTTRTPLPEQYPVSGVKDVTRAFAAAHEAVRALRADLPGGDRPLPRGLRGPDRGPSRRARRAGRPRDRPACDSAPALRRAAARDEPDAAGRGCGPRSFVVPGHDRQQGQHPLDARGPRRPGRRLRAEQLPVRLQLRRGRRFRGRDRRRQSRDRQGEHRPPRDEPHARRVRPRGGARVFAALPAWCSSSTARRPTSDSRSSPIRPSAPRASRAARAPGCA